MITEVGSLADVATLREQTALTGFIYRGQSDYSWELRATIQRPEHQTILNNEVQVYGQFRQALQVRHLPIRPTQPQAAGQWLALMQHYELPTRLLDWTKDLHVGLHFACCGNSNLDGALYVLNPFPLYQAAQSYMSSIPSMLIAPETIPYFNFPEARFMYFQSSHGDPVVVPIGPLAPNEREQIQNGVFTVSNGIAMSQDGIIQTLIPSPADNFVKVRIEQATKSAILQFLESQHGLSHKYLMSPIGELASRIRAIYT